MPRSESFKESPLTSSTIINAALQAGRHLLLGALNGVGIYIGIWWARRWFSVPMIDESGVDSNEIDPEPKRSTPSPPRDTNRANGRTFSQDTRDGESPSSDPNKERYLEMLVHNVAHTDLVLSLGGTEDGAPDNNNDDKNNRDTATPKGGGGNPRPPPELVLCRPRFSAFDLFSRRVAHALRPHTPAGGKKKDPKSLNVISFPRYERSDATPRYALVTPRPSRQMMLPVGLDLNDEYGLVDGEGPLDVNLWSDLPNLRIRGRDCFKIHGLEDVLRAHQNQTSTQQQGEEGLGGGVSPSQKLFLNGVYFPLLATLLTKWEKHIQSKFSNSKPSRRHVKKVVILVSGVGTPRNYTHSVEGNSTQCCAELMEIFLKYLYPDVTVVRIHSNTNIFRYDENITFTKRELMPCIDSYRDAHAKNLPYPDECPSSSSSSKHPQFQKHHEFNTEWKQSFHITLSFADGSPARTHAIQAALRAYHPTYYHVWQLKTFWHEGKITQEDVEMHSFQDMETIPAVDVSNLADKSAVRMVVKEMLDFKREFLESMLGDNDIRQFWLRKTKKPVLAILLVDRHTKNGNAHDHNDDHVSSDKDSPRSLLFRGTNMEVSMPTGSLCAERNVIGTALATLPGLRREDLRMVAVLAVPLPEEVIHTHPSTTYQTDTPPGQPEEVLLNDVREVLEKQVTNDCREGMKRSMSFTSNTSIVQEMHHNDSPLELEGSWIDPMADQFHSKPVTNVPPLYLQGLSTPHPVSPPGTPVRRINLCTNADSHCDTDPNKHSTKPRMGAGGRRNKRTVVVHSQKDINPLRPCGACNEWLKKIAESNPYFKVLTFTDADCNGVYVTPCQE